MYFPRKLHVYSSPIQQLQMKGIEVTYLAFNAMKYDIIMRTQRIIDTQRYLLCFEVNFFQLAYKQQVHLCSNVHPNM